MDTKKKKSKAPTSKKVDYKKYGPTVRISWPVYNFIISNGTFQESFDDVLKRLLKVQE